MLLAEGQTKCFENYLDLVNLTYFGPSTSLPGSMTAANPSVAPQKLKSEDNLNFTKPEQAAKNQAE